MTRSLGCCTNSVDAYSYTLRHVVGRAAHLLEIDFGDKQEALTVGCTTYFEDLSSETNLIVG